MTQMDKRKILCAEATEEYQNLPPHLKRVHVNARIQKWMLDELKKQGEVGIVLEHILERKAGFKYQPEIQNKN